jgi:hypothetical protein
MSRYLRKFAVGATAMLMTGAAHQCLAQPATMNPRGGAVSPRGVEVRPPDYGSFDASIWVGKSVYNIGEPIRINLRVSQDAYVYVFSLGPDGSERQIFPNYYDKSNFLRANRTKVLPGSNYSLTVSGPPGENALTLIAFRKNHPFLSEWQRFSAGDPYPSARGGAKAMASRAQSLRGVVVGPGSSDVAEAYATFIVRGSGGSGGWGGSGWGDNRYGALAIRTDPEGANVFVDGRLVGRTPDIFRRIEPGMRRVRVERGGYWAAEATLRIERGETRKVEIDLERIRD